MLANNATHSRNSTWSYGFARMMQCAITILSVPADNEHQDKLFEQISIEEYRAIVRPKVQIVYNLHNTLPKAELDFFVMLSSVLELQVYMQREGLDYA